MGFVKNTLGALALTGALSLAGCGTDTVTTQQKATVCDVVENGRNIRVMPITSNKHYRDKKQEEVRKNLEEVVNGGKYNIISIKTFYSDQFLTSAEVKYSVDNDCGNPNLRVIFVHSNKHYWDKKQEEIKSSLDSLVNRGNLDVEEVNTIMLKGYLVAAEIYYNASK